MKLPKDKLIEYLNSINEDEIEENDLYDLKNKLNDKYNLFPRKISEIDLSKYGFSIDMSWDYSDKKVNLSKKMDKKLSDLKIDKPLVKVYTFFIHVGELEFNNEFIVLELNAIKDVMTPIWTPYKKWEEFFGPNLGIGLKHIFQYGNQCSQQLDSFKDYLPSEIKEILLFI